MPLTQTARTKRIVIAAASALVILGIAAAGWTLVRGLFDPQYNVTLPLLLGHQSDAVDVTDRLCGPALTCVEAYDTDEATYYRFPARDGATTFALTVADGFQSNYIVMDFAGKDSSSKLKQLWAMQSLAGFWNDYEGGFPAR